MLLHLSKSLLHIGICWLAFEVTPMDVSKVPRMDAFEINKGAQLSSFPDMCLLFAYSCTDTSKAIAVSSLQV